MELLALVIDMIIVVVLTIAFVMFTLGLIRDVRKPDKDAYTKLNIRYNIALIYIVLGLLYSIGRRLAEHWTQFVG